MTSTFPPCEVCGWEFMAGPEDHAREDELHLGTALHQFSALGAAGREALAVIKSEGERFLRREGRP